MVKNALIITGGPCANKEVLTHLPDIDLVIAADSGFDNALFNFFPKPFQAKIYSTNTAPANRDANQPEMAVTTGLSAFFIA